MIASVLAFQVVLPLVLLLWLAVAPLGSVSGFALQAAGIAAFLFALARVAQWALPVWWLPWVYAALWLGIVGIHLIRAHLGGLPLLPAGLWGWAGSGLALVFLGLGGWFGGQALSGRAPPPVQIVEIANPFGPGTYLVGHGGSNTQVNRHMRTLDPSVDRFRPWRGQSYAVDFFGLGPWGLRASGWRPADPAAYAIFGAALRAPCAGTVVRAARDWPDYEIPESDQVNRLGNHVILRCGGAEIVFAHMRQGRVAVAPGDRVDVGDPLGEVGNTGASTEPHLHIHAQRPAPDGAPPISGEPLGLRIDGRFLVRGDKVIGADG
jgi:hypothetical protein